MSHGHRGRPREFDQTVSVRLPQKLHDALSQEALQRRMDLSDVLRERLSVSQNTKRADSSA